MSIALIPCDEQEDFILEDSPLTRRLKYLSQTGDVEILQHGLNHVYSGIGEMDGYTFVEQFLRLHFMCYTYCRVCISRLFNIGWLRFLTGIMLLSTLIAVVVSLFDKPK